MSNSNWFSKQVLSWYGEAGRKDLPWQQPASPYRVWISEIMLQQTQVKTVIPYFIKFIKRFPNVETLAKASVDEVLSHWAGLGYYARGRNLHRAAQEIVEHDQGIIPSELDDLIALPGIGRSTAGAIRSLGFEQRATILDGNVKRVLSRYHAIETWPGEKETSNLLWSLAEGHTPQNQFREYTQAMMDLGATVCTLRAPNCAHCPLQTRCKGFKTGNPRQFPKTKARAPLPVKTIQFLCCLNDRGEVLLEKRPNFGIWGGLWSFPETLANADPKSICHDEWGLSVQIKSKFEVKRHTFTHYHLDFQTVVLKTRQSPSKLAKTNAAWYKLEPKLKVGLPKPVAAIWSALCRDKAS
ncbi:MAG: A/G-specific adenine glycosylase [Gammaproteobacteria bacterium]